MVGSDWHRCRLHVERRQALSLAGTNWPLLTVGMVQRGFSDEEVRKIVGGNVPRVVQAALAP